MSTYDIARVPVKDLKKGVTYYITYDYWPHGGSPVKLVRHATEKELFGKGRRLCAEVREVRSGTPFYLMPDSWLFAEEPKQEGDRTVTI